MSDRDQPTPPAALRPAPAGDLPEDELSHLEATASWLQSKPYDVCLPHASDVELGRAVARLVDEVRRRRAAAPPPPQATLGLAVTGDLRTRATVTRYTPGPDPRQVWSVVCPVTQDEVDALALAALRPTGPVDSRQPLISLLRKLTPDSPDLAAADRLARRAGRTRAGAGTGAPTREDES